MSSSIRLDRSTKRSGGCASGSTRGRSDSSHEEEVIHGYARRTVPKPSRTPASEEEAAAESPAEASDDAPSRARDVCARIRAEPGQTSVAQEHAKECESREEHESTRAPSF